MDRGCFSPVLFFLLPMLRSRTCYFYFFLVLLFTITKTWGQEISISPAILLFDGEPGQSMSKTIKLTNHGKKVYDFQVTIKDWTRDSIGTKIYAEQGTMPNSNANWIRVNETIVRILPGQDLQMTIQMEIPAGHVGDFTSNSMFFLTQINAERQQTNHPSIGIQINYEFGVQIFHNPVGAKKGEVIFKNLSYLENKETGKRQIRVDFENNGHLHKSGQIRFEMTNTENGRDYKLNELAFAIMPLGKQYQLIDIPKELEAGKFHLVALLDAGAGYELNIAEKKIDVGF